MARPRRGLVPALALTALLVLYTWAVATRGVALVRTGDPAGIGIGAAVLVVPLVVIGLIAREWLLATRVQQMADELAEAGELPVDTLPRSPGGRIDRAAADEAFQHARAAAERDDAGWREWYHLAFAYDAAGDRRRARHALRTAAALRKSA